MKGCFYVPFLAVIAFSCGQTNPPHPADEGLGALFNRSKDALVSLELDVERLDVPVETSRLGVGFFISPKGTVLTAGHLVPTSRSVVIDFKSDGPTSRAFVGTVVKRDKRLDLAVLEPQVPIPPTKFLRLDLEKAAAPGDRVAILTLLTRSRLSGDDAYYATGVLPATVFSVFREGSFALDVYAFSGISGSPILDLSSGGVIGVCHKRARNSVFPERENLPYQLSDGTSISLRVPYLIMDYGIGYSLTPARDFLREFR